MQKKRKQLLRRLLVRRVIGKAATRSRQAAQEVQANAEVPAQEDYAADKVEQTAAETAAATPDLFAQACRGAYAWQEKSAAERQTARRRTSNEPPAGSRKVAVRGRQTGLAQQQRRKAWGQPMLRREAILRRQARGAAGSAFPFGRGGTTASSYRVGTMASSYRAGAATRLRLRPQPPAGGVRSLAQRVGNRLAAALRRTAKEMGGGLLALLGGGSVVLLLAMSVAAVAMVVGSPLGVLFADESGDSNAIPMAQIVQETNGAFAQAVNELAAAHPECSEVDIHYQYENGHTWASYWPEVLAVFAVDANLGQGQAVAVVDAQKRAQLETTFWEMHRIASSVETVEIPPDPQDAAGATTYRYILHIWVSSYPVEQLAADKGFTGDQLDMLHELLSAEMRPMLVALTSGLPQSGHSTLQWPLPGYTAVSTPFGVEDAFGNPGHKGIDLPAPEGTPILAAHGGTVLVSSWSDSYGNQVLLDDGAGLSTRYAHMTQTAVTAGDTVTAGQVIGYVGSTGLSTGNHLHFEVCVNGVLLDPETVVEGRG